jgi:glycosyltransferase involved in cell wall biosynthesis
MNTKPLISVITVVYNGVDFIEETIKSIINQNYDNVEYILIDGGSTDGTVDIIKQYESKIAYWISEPDNGISDAFNKGIKVSNGDYINFQGDGDGFVSLNVLDKVFEGVNPKEDALVSARIQRVDKDGCELFTSRHIKNFRKKSLLFRMSLPHQGLFVHKSYFEKYGPFDINNTFCMDYDHLLRSYGDFPKVVTKDVVVARWREDGLGGGRTKEVLEEYDRIKKKNKVANRLTLRLINNWTLFKYYITIFLKRN